MKRPMCKLIAAATLLASSGARADDATPPGATPPTSTTTLSSAEPAAAEPSPSIAPEPRAAERDTLTVNQSVRPNRPLLYTGGLLLLATYATTAAVTAGNVPDTSNADKTLYLPVVGPWLHLADIDESTTDTLLIASSGVLQGAGVALMISALFVPEKIPAATIQAGNVKVDISPASYGRGSAGIGALGTF